MQNYEIIIFGWFTSLGGVIPRACGGGSKSWVSNYDRDLCG